MAEGKSEVNVLVPKRGKMPEPSPEQMKAFMEQQKKAQEIQKAFLKDIRPFQKKIAELFKAMMKCKECKESKYKFIPCEKHYSLLKSMAQKIQDVKTYYELKQQFARIK